MIVPTAEEVKKYFDAPFRWRKEIILRLLPKDEKRELRFGTPESGPFESVLFRNGRSSKSRKLAVICDVTFREDGEIWQHVSYSTPDNVPTHEDTVRVRESFFDPDLVVVQVFPPRGEYVNFHYNCLHLWARLTGPRLVCDLRMTDLDGTKTI